MGRYWSDQQLDSVIPPQVRDERGKAILSTLDHLIGVRSLTEFYVRDADTCPKEALPALIAEYSMEEFIAPSLPEHMQRRILKNTWLLQSLKGYDAGVRLGLELLGMQMNIRHWHQEEPKGPANTHTITFMVGEIFFDEDRILGPRTLEAARKMIKATKRWSQESQIRIGVNMRQRVQIAAAATSMGISISTGTAKRPTDFKNHVGISPVITHLTVVRPKAKASRPTQFKKGIRAVSIASVLKIIQISAQAA